MLKHLPLTGLILVAAFTLPASLAGQAIETAGEVIQTSVSMSGSASSLELELASGRTLKILLADGLVYVDGGEIGRYVEGGTLESGWRGLLNGIAEGNWTDAWASFLERDYAAADALAGSMDDPSREVRESALRALIRMCDEAANQVREARNRYDGIPAEDEGRTEEREAVKAVLDECRLVQFLYP